MIYNIMKLFSLYTAAFIFTIADLLGFYDKN